jgi:hypothetical protein
MHRSNSQQGKVLRIFRILIIGGLALGVALFSSYIAFNNYKVEYPDRADILKSRNAATAWIRAHEQELLETKNPPLWWMLKESARISGDAGLEALYQKYVDRYIKNNSGNYWHHLFDNESKIRIDPDNLLGFPDYGMLILYGLSCQNQLRSLPEVKRLLQPDACSPYGTLAYFQDMACTTHQLLGIWFIEQSACENEATTAELIRRLQDKIAFQAMLDPRLLDNYIQRVLLLQKTGAKAKIKPIWIRRILAAQRSDGGWADFDALSPGWHGTYFGWSNRSVRVRQPESNFHTTVQGLMLMSLLIADTKSAH